MGRAIGYLEVGCLEAEKRVLRAIGYACREELKHQDSIRKIRKAVSPFYLHDVCQEELKMKRIYMKISLIAVLFLPIQEAPAAGLSGVKNFKSALSGFEEVPANSTTGTGRFSARLDSGETALTYVLDYSGLEGEITTAAHVHLGQIGANGGISFFLCGNDNTPVCPATQGRVSGSVTADDVVGPDGQGIAAGEFAEIIAAMRKGVTYVNVHTEKHPAGEIRGQIKSSRQNGSTFPFRALP
jgi:hypothetical protein